MPHASPRPAAQLLLFGRNFFKHPKMLGSLIPSSRFLVQRLLRRVPWGEARVVVEYGPGVGTLTTGILRRMRPDATLVAVDTNAEFVEFLRRHVSDPRLRVVQRSAADIRDILGDAGLGRADVVISGIPFSTLPPGLRDEILVATRDVLADGGMLLVFQFSRAVLAALRRRFDVVRQEFEPLNVMPAHVFECRVPGRRGRAAGPAPRVSRARLAE